MGGGPKLSGGRDDRSQTAHLVHIGELRVRIPPIPTAIFVGRNIVVLCRVHIVDRNQGRLIVFLHFVAILIERLVVLAEIGAVAAEGSRLGQCCSMLPQIPDLLEASRALREDGFFAEVGRILRRCFGNVLMLGVDDNVMASERGRLAGL